MKLSTDRDALLSLIAATAAATDQAPYVRLVATGHALACEGVSPELAIRVRAPAGVEEEGEMAVPARTLARLIARLPQGTVQLEAAYPHLSIAYEGGTASLVGADAIMVGEFPESDAGHAALPNGAFATLIPQVAFAAARQEEGRPQLTGVRLEARGGRLHAVATDGMRLAMASLPFEGSVAVTLSRKAAALLRELSRQDPQATVAQERGQLHYRSAAAAAAITTLAYAYPDVWHVRQSLPAGACIAVSRQAFLEAVARAEAVLLDRRHAIALGLGPRGLSVAAASDEGSVHTVLPGERYGRRDDIGCRVRAEFLARPLRALPQEVEAVRLHITGQATALLLQAEAGDLLVEHIIMPVISA
ncbi:MAG: DNA polymerase III subunit beta [Chloroflexota bacterium]|nr:DNA polymerase III subunit beta [Chloroflexota bacterium]